MDRWTGLSSRVHSTFKSHVKCSSHLWDCQPEFTPRLRRLLVDAGSHFTLRGCYFLGNSQPSQIPMATLKNCSPVCHFKVTYVSRETHGHSEITVSISASILDRSIFTLQVVLRLSCRGLLVGALYHSAFQSVVTEARLRRNQVQAHGHKAFVLGTPETP